MWRPNDWKNPWIKTIPHSAGHSAFEAGADAILKALMELGVPADGLAPTLSINVSPEQKGWLVFIPEENNGD